MDMIADLKESDVDRIQLPNAVGVFQAYLSVSAVLYTLLGSADFILRLSCNFIVKTL